MKRRARSAKNDGKPPVARIGLELHCEYVMDIWDKDKKRYKKVRCNRKLSIYNQTKRGEAMCYEHKQPERGHDRRGRGW